MRVFERLVEKRGISEEFLRPKYEKLADFRLLPDIEKAAERIIMAANRGEKVLIYGDYDVDGVTASTAMYDTLRLAGVKDVKTILPNRFRDGYGMSERVVEEAVVRGVALVVTVDCGSRNKEIIEKLAQTGIDTIVTDHHECGTELPAAVAVVNPKRKDFEEAVATGLRDLAGVGVVFEVARALVAKGAIPNGQEKWLLDLVLIGTLCDAMRISKENRILTYFGMKVLAKTRRPGLKELMRAARVDKLSAETVGFRLGPRLNAAGRLESAELALELLMTKDRAEAARLAMRLEILNKERRRVQDEAVNEIIKRGVSENPVIVITGNWQEGVLGIIAGKLVEKYKRPAFVLAKVGEMYKGSGRSFGEFDLAKALAACEGEIIGGGGHAEACGVKVKPEKLLDFEGAINTYYNGLGLVEQERYLWQSEDLETGELGGFSLELMEELAELEPFGEGNREPSFLLDVVVMEARKMGADGQHLSLFVRGAEGGDLRLIAFFAPQEWMELVPGESVKVLVTLMENEFRGLRNVEGRLLDVRRG